MAPTLILDTNVLVAGLRSSLGASHALLRLVGTGRFTLGLTAALVLEYEAVCMRSLDALGLAVEEVGVLLDHLCAVGKPAAVRFRVRPSTADPGMSSSWRRRWRQGAIGWSRTMSGTWPPVRPDSALRC
jgi:hypothetical protein